MPTSRLDEIGRRLGTDKSSLHHDYLRHYERLFALAPPIRTMLEIGVHGGASVRTWAEFLPGARIIGMDIDPNCRGFAGDRITIEIADQSNPFDLAAVGAKHGPFDVVLDDGSHLWPHQILTFETLFPLVRPGGLYILEDIDTSFGHYVPNFSQGAMRSAADHVGDIARHLIAGGALPPDELDLRSRAFLDRIEMITYIRRSAIVFTRPD